MVFILLTASFRLSGSLIVAWSIRFEPEELLRGVESIGERTRRADNVGERVGEGGRGLQIEIGVGPTQHQLIMQQLNIQMNRWRHACRVFDDHGFGRIITAV